jgi:hypothetical protein
VLRQPLAFGRWHIRVCLLCLLQYKGKAIVDYDFRGYRKYVGLLLVTANGVINGWGWIMQHKWGWSSDVRWVLACFLSPVVLLIPPLIQIAKGQPNGQYHSKRSSPPSDCCRPRIDWDFSSFISRVDWDFSTLRGIGRREYMLGQVQRA